MTDNRQRDQTLENKDASPVVDKTKDRDVAQISKEKDSPRLGNNDKERILDHKENEAHKEKDPVKDQTFNKNNNNINDSNKSKEVNKDDRREKESFTEQKDKFSNLDTHHNKEKELSPKQNNLALLVIKEVNDDRIKQAVNAKI